MTNSSGTGAAVLASDQARCSKAANTRRNPLRIGSERLRRGGSGSFQDHEKSRGAQITESFCSFATNDEIRTILKCG
jgi:hypothetical protein